MADVRIIDLPSGAPTAAHKMPIDLSETQSATISDIGDAARPFASQAEAEAGTSNTKTMTPLTSAQQLAALGPTLFATTSEGALAATALQPDDVAALAFKDKAGIEDIDATGSPTSTTFLAGNGSWVFLPGGGNMLSSVYDPNSVGEEVAFKSQTATADQGVKADTALQPTTGLPRYMSRTAAVGSAVAAPVLSISVLQGTLLLNFVRDDDGTALQTADGGWWSPVNEVYPEHFAENTVPGTTDMTAACQAAIDWAADHDVDGIFSQTIYGVTGLVWKEGASFRGAGNWSGVTYLNPEAGTTVFRYIGAGGANSFVIRFSKDAVGTVGDASSNMSNMALSQVTVDGNKLAEFGFYFNRSWSNCEFDYLTATNTLKHGFWAGNCWNGSPTNWMAYKNIGAGITLGINTFGWAQCVIDQSVATGFFGYYSGYAIDESGASPPPRSAFSDAAPNLEYGIGLGSHRAFVMLNAQANECSGAGIYRSQGLFSPLKLIGGYVENNGKSTNATRRWDLWWDVGPSALNDVIDGMHFGVATTGAIKITGTPNTSRVEASLKLMNSPILPTIDADHIYWRLVDCDRDPTAITNKSPIQFAGRVASSMNMVPVGQVIFWYNTVTSAITIVRQEGDISGVSYNGVGDYTLTLGRAQAGGAWIAMCETPASNRRLFAANYTTTTCELFHQSLTTAAAADPTAANLAIRVVVFGYLA